MIETYPISAKFPYQSKFLDVKNSKIHYIDEGEGDPIIFLHGVPVCNYLWRNIIPELSDKARCIAPDLIGMGKSGKPDIDYRIFDHIDYITEFIDQLKLDNITFVLHGWGSVVGFHYAMQNREKLKALAFYESHVRPVVDWNMLSLPVQQFAMLLHSKANYKSIINGNYFIRKMLPRGVLRKLTDDEIAYYAEPYQTPESRKPLWQYTQDLPLGDGPDDVVELIRDYSKKLQHSKVPKLILYAVPGFITPINTVKWVRDHLPNVELCDLGEGLHFAQETDPIKFREAISNWYCGL